MPKEGSKLGPSLWAYREHAIRILQTPSTADQERLKRKREYYGVDLAEYDISQTAEHLITSNSRVLFIPDPRIACPDIYTSAGFWD